MKRLFLAIDLPQRVIDDISATYMAIPGARWVHEDQLHLTLRFFGELPGDREAALIKSLSSVTQPPFYLQVKGAGFFPPRGEPRILWVGIASQPELGRLASSIEHCVVKAGFEREPRKFSAHISTARLNGSPSDRVAQYIIVNSLFATEPFEVSTFHLYSSHLGRDRATYTREVSFALNRQSLPF
jgi:2'-5' RNA ligase